MAKRDKARTLKQAKQDMDARVLELRAVVARGGVASSRLPGLRDQLDATQCYLRSSCMYESARYEEGEKTPEDLEREIETLEKDIAAANIARSQLKEAKRFYRAYHLVAYMPILRDLKTRLNAAEYWAEQWQSRICAVEFDADKDIDERIQEKSILECEYSKVNDEVCKLRAQIAEIRNVKYM